MFLAYQAEKRKYHERLVFETLRDDDLAIQNAALDALKTRLQTRRPETAPQSTPKGNQVE